MESARILRRLGLDRPELRAWAMYDWANSAFVLTVQTAVFPIFFLRVSGAGLPEGLATQRFAWTTSLALLTVALMAPILGALADYAGIKKRFLAIFLGLGASTTAAMFFLREGDWVTAAILFGLANIGAQGSFVFYESLLPHVARGREMDRLTTSAFAIGYLGSSILLVFQLGWILRPELFGLPSGPGLSAEQATLPTRLAFLSVAVWWVLFSLPLFLRVPEPPRRLEPDERPGAPAARVAFQRIGETFRELRLYREALLMLIAFLIYNDGIGTIIRMAPIYGAEIGIGTTDLIVAILLVQLIGIPFAILFGTLAGRTGPKPMILAGLGVYIGIAILGYFMRTALHFYLLAVFVGIVQGGTQALSRSLFASLIPRHKSAEFFGFFGVMDKFAGIFGPFLFGLTVALTGSSRQAILSVIVFFVVGAYLLTRVRVEPGRAAARRAEAALEEP
ncbi:MAG TPA: MFS transporter [Gemmatimonadota bacterium]|nr:MFS transporter [Gemmatimonadota bacterium]